MSYETPQIIPEGLSVESEIRIAESTLRASAEELERVAKEFFGGEPPTPEQMEQLLKGFGKKE